MKPSPQWAEIVEQFEKRIRAYFLSRLGDKSSADDLVQETLIKIGRKLGSLKNSAALDSWIMQIAHRHLLDHLRKEKKTQPLSDNQGQTSTLIHPETPDTEEAKLRIELHDYLRNVVEQLAPKHREALLMTEYQGLTQKEAAERLGISLSSMKSRVLRARAEMKGVIQKCCHWETDIYGQVTEVRPRHQESCPDNC